MTDWQPIEAPPPEGVEVLCCFVDPNDFNLPLSAFNWPEQLTAGPWTATVIDGIWVPTWDGQPVIDSQSDWYTKDKCFWVLPTHWAPKPATPPLSRCTGTPAAARGDVMTNLQPVKKLPPDGVEVLGFVVHANDAKVPPSALSWPYRLTSGPWTCTVINRIWVPTWGGEPVIEEQNDWSTRYKKFWEWPTHWAPMPATPPFRAGPEPLVLPKVAPIPR